MSCRIECVTVCLPLSVVTLLSYILSLGFRYFPCAILHNPWDLNTTIDETGLLSEAQRESNWCWLTDVLGILTWIQASICRLPFLNELPAKGQNIIPERIFSRTFDLADILLSGVTYLWHCNSSLANMLIIVKHLSWPWIEFCFPKLPIAMTHFLYKTITLTCVALSIHLLALIPICQ